MDNNLGCFHFGTIVTNSAVNMGIEITQITLWVPGFHSLECNPEVEVLGYTALVFNFLRSRHTVVQSDGTGLHSH